MGGENLSISFEIDARQVKFFNSSPSPLCVTIIVISCPGWMGGMFHTNPEEVGDFKKNKFFGRKIEDKKTKIDI